MQGIYDIPKVNDIHTYLGMMTWHASHALRRLYYVYCITPRYGCNGSSSVAGVQQSPFSRPNSFGPSPRFLPMRPRLLFI